MNEQRATLCVVGAGVLWGIISLFIRHLTAAGLSSLQSGFVRTAIAAVVMAAILLVKDRSLFRVRLKDLWCFVGSGIISLSFFSWCYFTTMQESGASVAVVLLYTSPVFVMLLSAVLFKEQVTGQKLAAVAMVFCGCVLVAGLVGGGVQLSVRVLLLGLGSGFGYATYSIFGRFALDRGYPPLTVTFYTFVFSAVSLIPLCRPIELVRCIAAAPQTLGWGIAIAVVCAVAPYLLYTLGLQHLEAGKAAVLVTVEPMVGAIVGICLYGEAHNAAKLLGMGLIFAAVVLLNLPGRRQAKEPQTQS